MFTGLIEGTGIITRLDFKKEGALIEVKTSFPLDDTKIGDSIAVDGACLTAIKVGRNSFSAEVSPETLSKTTFKYKKVGDVVNLERALKLGDRLGGHLVSGHIDGVGKILSITKLEKFFHFEVEVPEHLAKYLVKKGSIAIDGISLTINDLSKNVVKLMIIPHTYNVTNLSKKTPGDLVNIEIDMIAKMVYQWITPYLENPMKSSESGISLEFLKNHGFL